MVGGFFIIRRARVMILDAFSEELKDLKACIERKIQHSYLDKYIENAVIDDCKLFIIYSIINKASLSEEKKRKYIISIILIQIALDTHDLVPASNDAHDRKANPKSRQLLVLAGDYYSGLYYFLLSEIEDFAMIQTLATTIKEINELKMKLYYNEAKSFNEMILIVKKLESLLITRVTEWLTELAITPFIEDLLLTHKLIKEKLFIYQNGYSSIFANWLETENMHLSSILEQIEMMITKYIDDLELYLQQSTMKHSLYHLHFDKLLSELTYDVKSFVEEG